MASQKRSRTASGQAKTGGTATRSGSGSTGSAGSGSSSGRSGSGSSGRGGGRATQVTPVRTGKNGRGGPGGGPGQNDGRAQRNQGQRNQGQSNRGPDTRGAGGRTAQGRPAGPPRQAASQVAVAAVSAADDRFTAPAWLRWTSLVLSLAGLGVSIYLTIAHYTSPKFLICSDKGLINCAKVTSSPESVVFGVFPVAVLGLAFYVFMVAVNSPWGWQLRIPLVWWARIGSAVVGIGFVLYLVYAEIIQIGNICLWCTSVHVITFLLFALLIFAASLGSSTTATKPAS
jgi:uncharacterized membrane protein